MKGVGMIRVTYRPHAYCLGPPDAAVTDPECTFDRRGISNTVRIEAQRHAYVTGHTVLVDVIDRTTCTREETP